MTPEEKCCYEGYRTSDREDAVYRDDADADDDKLESCEKGCLDSNGSESDGSYSDGSESYGLDSGSLEPDDLGLDSEKANKRASPE